jgi:eukaryotic-like serine/threonine-protein kinase
VLRELGHGGMATVYLARDVPHDRLIALKLLRAELTGVAGDDRFLREIKILAKLQHPNILSLHDSGILDLEGGLRLPFYTMPYVEGESLRERLQAERKLTSAESVRILREIADALSAAHAAGVVHRDLKPENVLLSQGHAMVSDFGIARAMSSATEAGNLTGTGLVLGTPAYMAPEQAVAEPEMDHRADLYSLGVIAYELFAGAPPFDARTPQQMLVAHATVAPEPIGKRAPTLDAALAELVMRLLEKRPQDRPASAAEVVAALDAIAAGGNVWRPAANRVRRAAVLAALVVIGVFTGWLVIRSRAQRAPSATPVAADASDASVAVLPFENLSGDKQQDYFSDGMAEQLMYALSKVEGLRVSPRASAFAFRGRGAALREIGAKLHVAYVIEATLRQVGNRLRVNAQLINIATGRADWSDEYRGEMSDVFQVQDDIASKIVGALRARLTAGATGPVVGAGTRSVEAYTLYLQGRYFFEKKDSVSFIKAQDYFRRAIRSDSSYALAYAGLAIAYTHQATFGFAPLTSNLLKAKEYASRALGLDSTLVEVHTSLAFITLFYDWNWPAAGREFDTALRLDERDSPAHLFHAWYFMAIDSMNAAIGEGRRAVDLDPFSPLNNTRLVGFLFYGGRYAEAIEWGRKTFERDSNFAGLRQELARDYVELGLCAEALAVLEHSVDSPVGGLGGIRGYTYAKCDRRAQALAELAHLRGRPNYVSHYALAVIEAGLGNKDQAFAELEKAYIGHEWPMFIIRVEPALAGLRSDPRFAALVKKVGLTT